MDATEKSTPSIRKFEKRQGAGQYSTNCRSRDVVLTGQYKRIWHGLPIGMRPTLIVGHVHYLQCRRWGITRLESLDIAESRKSYIRALARCVVELAEDMTKEAIACKVKLVGWDTIKAIIKEDLKRRRKLNKVRFIAIDEMAVKKGHRYLTNVVDLETGQVIYSAEGGDTECLRPFLEKIKRSRMEQLLNHYDYPISTGPLEGINNKIKVLKRAAYGFRNMESFKLRSLLIREASFTLVGA